MNRFLAGCLSLLLAAFVAGCSDDDDAPRDLVLSDNTQTTQTVYADQTSGTGGGISFTALSDWTATVTDVTDTKATTDGTVDWLTLSAYSGGPGDYTLTLTLTENLTGQDRKAQIEIVCGASRITIIVEQKGTTEGGDTPSVPQEGDRLARMEYTSINSDNPDYYTKVILTFAYNRDGLLGEVHDIAYYGDEQAYYSEDIYAFGYDENARLQRIERHSDYGYDHAYVIQTNDAGDIALLYEDTGSSTVTAWRFDYDENRFRHHQPLSFALTLRKEFAHGLSLESGLVYTLLRSDVRKPFASDDIAQQLHFVGIPLRVNWQFLHRRGFHLYIGAGGQIEKCVYAKFGSKVVTEHGVQWSAFGVAGAEYRFGRTVGLYFEPELSYYFTRTELRTARTDDPLTLTLRLGLRFSF